MLHRPPGCVTRTAGVLLTLVTTDCSGHWSVPSPAAALPHTGQPDTAATQHYWVAIVFMISYAVVAVWLCQLLRRPADANITILCATNNDT